ncbi:MAG: sulfotransferase [Halioglobus sp.]
MSPGELPSRVTYEQALGASSKFLDSGNFQSAEYILGQLAEQYSADSEPLLRLLKLYTHSRQFDDALPVAERLLALFPVNVSVLAQVAMGFHVMEKPREALTLGERALALQPGNPQVLQTLAVASQSLGDSKQAVHYYDEALKVVPNNATLLNAKARSIGRHATRDFINHLESICTQSNTLDNDKALLYFALAWCYERSDMEAHFRNLDAANSLIQPSRPWHEGPYKTVLERSRRLFTKETVAQFRKYGDDSVSPVFIAALPRSGTTLLENMLGAHSATYQVGESAAMDNALLKTQFRANPMNSDTLFSELTDYRGDIGRVAEEFLVSSIIAPGKMHQIIDKTISNFYQVGMILMVFPQAKIIALRREPLDIIYSCYQQHFASGNNFIYSLTNLAKMYKLYVQFMSLWTELFPNNIHTLRYEDLVTDQERALRSTLEFCELPWEAECLNYHASLGSITTSSDHQVRQPLYQTSVDKWQSVETYLQEAIKELGETGSYSN